MSTTDSYTALEAGLLKAIFAGELSEEAFEHFACAIYAFQRARNEPYDRFCHHLGVPPEVEHWYEIPAVPQGMFKRYALRSFPESDGVAAFRTSGTTGESFGVHFFRSLRLYEASVLGGFSRAGIGGRTQFVLIPRAEDAPHSSLSHMMRILGGHYAQEYFLTPSGGLQTARLERSIAAAAEPVLILGTALVILRWCEELATRGGRLTLPAGSEIFETGGYKGARLELSKVDFYNSLWERLGVSPDHILNEYGMTELSSQFYARGLQRPHTAPPWVRARVIDPENGSEVRDGETGILQIHDLANLGSVLAVETRDLAIRRGAAFELIGRDPAALPRGCSRSADEFISR